MAETIPLVDEILRGDNRGLQLLAARGLVPLAPAELIPVQVRLVSLQDEEIAAAAARAILEIEPKIAADLIVEGAGTEVVEYFGRHFDHREVLGAVIRRRDVPRQLLAELAGKLDEELQELLLLRQDAIVELPEILDALEKNPRLGPYGRRRIEEYRQHLLPRERKPRKSRAELEKEVEALSEEEVVKALSEAKETPSEGDEEDLTGLTESQIRTLGVPIRMKLARGAPRGLRGILVRDPNPMVATAVLHHNALGDSEIEQIATNRAVVQDVLELIGNHRSWVRKYTVAVALVKNPRCPIGIAMRLLPRVAVRDLQSLARDRNVADAIRTGAKRLYKMKRG
ncbi:MAG: hypothetical protein OEM62_00525 [Acidobacteriota bacterium]|nr:hypothetical protein [Acidobacteriota bacterium]